MKFEGIPEKGSIVSELKKIEQSIGDPDVEAYEEVSACSLTCKVCKACTCEEESAIK